MVPLTFKIFNYYSVCSSGDSSSASFLAHVEECISNRESRFEEGLNSKVQLGIYKRFGKSIDFKEYLFYMENNDASSRLV